MKIGRITKVLEDKDRKETLIECDENRKIVISFYYPIDESFKEDRQALYMDLYSPREDEFINRFKGMVASGNEKEKENFIKELKTNIYNNAPISKEEKSYPVIIQLTGLGAPRDYITFNIEKLVSEGYVVFTIGHAYDNMLTVLPNGEILEIPDKDLTQEEKIDILNIREKDVLFMLNQLEKLNKEDDFMKDKLDLEKIGLIGHSLGGAAVFNACKTDSRVKAVALFDASLQFFNLEEDIKEGKTLEMPLLNFRRDGFDYKSSIQMFIDIMKEHFDGEKFKNEIIIYDKVLRDSEENQRKIYKYVTSYKSFIKLKDSNHITFTDYSMLAGKEMEGTILPVEKSHEIINNITIRFFNEFLCGKQGAYSEFIKNDEYVTLIDENGEDIK